VPFSTHDTAEHAQRLWTELIYLFLSFLPLSLSLYSLSFSLSFPLSFLAVSMPAGETAVEEGVSTPAGRVSSRKGGREEERESTEHREIEKGPALGARTLFSGCKYSGHQRSDDRLYRVDVTFRVSLDGGKKDGGGGAQKASKGAQKRLKRGS
jgi:hypothetical protein